MSQSMKYIYMYLFIYLDYFTDCDICAFSSKLYTHISLDHYIHYVFIIPLSRQREINALFEQTFSINSSRGVEGDGKGETYIMINKT